MNKETYEALKRIIELTRAELETTESTERYIRVKKDLKPIETWIKNNK